MGKVKGFKEGTLYTQDVTVRENGVKGMWDIAALA